MKTRNEDVMLLDMIIEIQLDRMVHVVWIQMAQINLVSDIVRSTAAAGAGDLAVW